MTLYSTSKASRSECQGPVEIRSSKGRTSTLHRLYRTFAGTMLVCMANHPSKRIFLDVTVFGVTFISLFIGFVSHVIDFF